MVRPFDFLRAARCDHPAAARGSRTAEARSRRASPGTSIVCLLQAAWLATGMAGAPRHPEVSLAGPLLLRLSWLPPDAGHPAGGGYRLIVIDNEHRLIAHNKDIRCPCDAGEISFQLDHEAARNFTSEAAYPGATDIPELIIASGRTFSMYVAAFDATSAASDAGMRLRVFHAGLHPCIAGVVKL